MWRLILPLLLFIPSVSADAAAADVPNLKLKQQLGLLNTGGAATAVFNAAFAEQDHGVADGACADADAVAQWTMDEASGNLTDECSGLVLTANGDPVYSVTSVNGTGVGITLDGTGDYFSRADDDTLDAGSTNDIVIEAVVNCGTAASCTGGIASKWASSTGYTLFLSGNNPNFRVGDGTDTALAGGTSISDDTWHVVRGTWDVSETKAQFYIDGIEATPDTDALVGSLDNATPFQIGAENGGNAVEAQVANVLTCIGPTAIADCPTRWDDGLTDTGGATPTFTRATTSTRLDRTIEEGQKVWSGNAAIGAPIDADGTLPESGDPVGVQIHAQSVHSALHNEDFGNAVWVETGTGVVAATDSTADPFGGTRADTLTDDDGAGVEKVCQTISGLTATNAYTAQLWYKLESGSPTPVLELDGTKQTCAAATSAWDGLSCDVTDASASGTSIDLCVYPAGDTAASTGSIYAFRPQVVAGSYYPHGRYPAVGASAVTHNADDLSYPNTGEAIVDAEEGTYVAWINSNWVSTSNQLTLFRAVKSGVGAFYVLHSNDGSTLGLKQDACTNPNVAIASFFDGGDQRVWRQVAVTWSKSANEVAGFKDGSQVGTTQNPASWGACDVSGTLHIGKSQAGSSPVNGHMSGVEFYAEPLTESQISTLYAAGNPTAALPPPGPERDVMLAARERMAHPDFPRPVFALNPKPLLEAQ